MARRRKKQIPNEPALAVRRSYRPSPRFALQISLGFHALFVLMLFRMVSEYAGEPEIPLVTVVRSSVARPAATPSFVAVPIAATDMPDEVNRPAAGVESLPHQETEFAAPGIAPLRHLAPVARRAIAPAVLPIASVAVPTDEIAPLPPADMPISVSPTLPSLGPTDTVADLPLRIAARTIYGPRPERPLGLATLPVVRDDKPPRRPATAFAHRFAGARTPPENRTAIDRGLEFLARMQRDDGRWQFRNLRGEMDPIAEFPSARADAAATGLALLAYFGAGYDHFDGRFRLVVKDGLDYLVRTQRERGDFFLEDGLANGQLTRFYSHGIATLALSEAVGMTGDQSLRDPAQRALDYLSGAHHRIPGSWRYLPGVDADASAIGWQLAALRSGQLAGLNVETETLAQIRDFLKERRNAESSSTNPVTAVVELAVDLHLGNAPDDQRRQAAVDEMIAHPPQIAPLPEDVNASDTTPPADALQRDTYYWYYGSQAMHNLGGDQWHAWSRQLYPQLIRSQVSTGRLAGSWDPDPAATSAMWFSGGGRLYLTAMNLLTLEIYNRHLPPSVDTAPEIARRPLE